jgi:MoaA/NifB/PqqE/SkfB family radical SAM enzyme
MARLGALVSHLFPNPRRKWHPLIAVFYLTYECGFRCPFCSDGAGNPYHRLDETVLPVAEAIRLLRIIRSKCDYLVITGGEPLRHPGFSEILAAVSGMGFRDVILTTNGFEVETHLRVIAENVTSLVFSLNSLDPKRSDHWFGKQGPTSGDTLRTILRNIDRVAQFSGRKPQIHISSVVTPENIPDLYEVFEFSRAHGFIFAACPQLVGVKAHSGLIGNLDYQRFYSFLIERKKRGEPVYGTIPYLEHMRDLRKFTCRPFTMLVVSPSGDVYYPCLEIGHRPGNLLVTPNLHVLRRRGEARFGAQPDCDTRCQSACALGFAMAFDHPWSALKDAIFC